MTLDDAEVDPVDAEIGNSRSSAAASLSRLDFEVEDVDSCAIARRSSFGGGRHARDRASATLPAWATRHARRPLGVTEV